MSVKILVVESEKEAREEYRRLIEKAETLQLVAATDDVKEALHILRTFQIDAVIMELELSKGSGIFLLEQIQTLHIEKPFIAVVTNVVSKVIYDAIRNMGVDYICTKKESGFTFSIPLSVIEISAPYQKTRESARNIKRYVNKKVLQDVYRKCIEEELMELGFSNKVLGTAYCRCAILYVLMSENKEISITKEVYPYVGIQFKANVGCVERNIRIAIEKVWMEQDIEKLRLHYPYDWNKNTGRPTNAEFIYNVTKKVKNVEKCRIM